MQWSPDGQRIATASEDGTVRLWRVTVPGLRQALLDATTECLTPEARANYLGETEPVAHMSYEACQRSQGRVPVYPDRPAPAADARATPAAGDGGSVEPASLAAAGTTPAPAERAGDEAPVGELDPSKESFGLETAAIDGWGASAGTDGFIWSKPDHQNIFVQLSVKPITGAADLAEVLRYQELFELRAPVRTAKGWHMAVTTADDDYRELVYIREVGRSQLICRTLMSRDGTDERGVLSAETLVKICDSAELR